MDDRGFIFTLAIILLLIPLILLMAYYHSTVSKTGGEDLVARMRCDELHYFVEDIQEDLSRSTTIFGRRAAIYALDEVIDSGNGLSNYSFNNCTEYSYTMNGSTAAISELVLCGTLYGSNVSYMVNHTLCEWFSKIIEAGSEMNFNTTIRLNDLRVVHSDPWNFAVMLDVRFIIEDEADMCYYRGNASTYALSSVVGLEDPLYPLNTDGEARKYIMNCTPEFDFTPVMGCGVGNGTCGGNAMFYSQIAGELSGLLDFCNTTPADQLSNWVLVIDKNFDEDCTVDNTSLSEYFNANSSKYFAGVIEYMNSSNFIRNCSVTVPWIRDTGELDEFAPIWGGPRAQGCNESVLEDGSCVLIRNIESCGIHQVVGGISSNSINTSCYSTSNPEDYISCSVDLPNGPSFFDRLDGNYNLSWKYVHQSLAYFNSSDIGLETLVSQYELGDKWITVNPNATWVDYLYWQDTPGCSVAGVCQYSSIKFKLDCSHADKYNLELCSQCSDVGAGYNVPPVSEVINPVNDSIVGCNTTVEVIVNGSDCDGNLSYVEVSVDDGGWARVNESSNWTLEWTPTLDGNHMICSRAVDDEQGVQAPYHCINVTALGCVNQLPDTFINAPSEGENVSCTTVNTTGSALDIDGMVELVEVRINGSSWEIADGAYSWSFLWTPSTDGIHFIQARAVDNDSEADATPANVSVNVVGCSPTEPLEKVAIEILQLVDDSSICATTYNTTNPLNLSLTIVNQMNESCNPLIYCINQLKTRVHSSGKSGWSDWINITAVDPGSTVNITVQIPTTEYFTLVDGKGYKIKVEQAGYCNGEVKTTEDTADGQREVDVNALSSAC